MASNTQRALTSMELKIPPPLYMAAFLLSMWLLKNNAPMLIWESGFFESLGVLLIIIGLLFDGWSFLGFVKSKTTINPLKPENANKLVTDRLYRFTRNPMYLGMVFILTGWSFYLGGLSSFLLLPIFILLLTKYQIAPEERILESIFGEEYLRYKTEVRRWI
jgi:protein-S-isoprenylcysteine O-methyltransferase Ste14